MKDTCWLIFNKNGVRRMAKGKIVGRSWEGKRERPALDAGEYAVRIAVSVPQSYFDDRPIPEATLEIPESAIIEPAVQVSIELPRVEEA